MSAAKKVPVLFLDRDGTINVDMGSGYLNDPENAKLIPGAGKAIVKAIQAGFKIAVITNQAGIAKGKTPKEALPLIHDKLCELIAKEAGIDRYQFDDVRFCPHHPDEKCRCRKPGIKMAEDSAKELHADLGRSFFIGDKVSDLECGERMGMRSILVLTGHGLESHAELRMSSLLRPTAVLPSLLEAVEFAIQKQLTETTDVE